LVNVQGACAQDQNLVTDLWSLRRKKSLRIQSDTDFLQKQQHNVDSGRLFSGFSSENIGAF
jgi:hypothetical protein